MHTLMHHENVGNALQQPQNSGGGVRGSRTRHGRTDDVSFQLLLSGLRSCRLISTPSDKNLPGGTFAQRGW